MGITKSKHVTTMGSGNGGGEGSGSYESECDGATGLTNKQKRKCKFIKRDIGKLNRDIKKITAAYIKKGVSKGKYKARVLLDVSKLKALYRKNFASAGYS